MKKSSANPSEGPLNERQQLIKQFILIPARNNAQYRMESFLNEFEPRLKHASATNEEAYKFVLAEHKKIYSC